MWIPWWSKKKDNVDFIMKEEERNAEYVMMQEEIKYRHCDKEGKK
jgi:hypothetical protein